MSRGLGRLQKVILGMAYERVLAGKAYVGVKARDVLVRYYGFPFACPPETVQSRALVFCRSAVGKKRYASGTVTVCQCFARLVRRGILESRGVGCGYVLTPKGFELAEKSTKLLS